MKTTKTIRNKALTLLLGLTVMVTMTSGSSSSMGLANTDANEFANAGYWIDPVVVTYDANKEFSDAGYWINPVVVTYDANKEFADAGYWIDPVVVTYSVPSHLAMNN